MSEPITSFRGTPFSNFYQAAVILDGFDYRSVEHAYQAAKTLDVKERKKVRDAPTAGKAKALGRKVTIRPDWEEVKVQVMRDLLRQKFAIWTNAARVLLETGDRDLIEVNTWGDRFWGECPRGTGENWLGRLLMARREELRGEIARERERDEEAARIDEDEEEPDDL